MCIRDRKAAESEPGAEEATVDESEAQAAEIEQEFAFYSDQEMCIRDSSSRGYLHTGWQRWNLVQKVRYCCNRRNR